MKYFKVYWNLSSNIIVCVSKFYFRIFVVLHPSNLLKILKIFLFLMQLNSCSEICSHWCFWNCKFFHLGVRSVNILSRVYSVSVSAHWRHEVINDLAAGCRHREFFSSCALFPILLQRIEWACRFRIVLWLTCHACKKSTHVFSFKKIISSQKPT